MGKHIRERNKPNLIQNNQNSLNYQISDDENKTKLQHNRNGKGFLSLIVPKLYLWSINLKDTLRNGIPHIKASRSSVVRLDICEISKLNINDLREDIREESRKRIFNRQFVDVKRDVENIDVVEAMLKWFNVWEVRRMEVRGRATEELEGFNRDGPDRISAEESSAHFSSLAYE